MVPFILFTMGFLGSGGTPVQDQAPAQNFRFSVVRIPVWVTDRQGIGQGKLQREDFTLRVDGSEVPIQHCYQTADRPLELVYMLDVSGSMEVGNKVAGSLETLDYLFKQHPPEDRWQLVLFSDGGILKVLDHERLDAWPALRQKISGYGKTAFFDALGKVPDFFTPESLNNRALVLFTDGNDNHSSFSEAQVLEWLKILELPVFIVAIADGFLPSDSGHRERMGLDLLNTMANLTGGKCFLLKDIGDLPQVREQLNASLRPQYLLTITVERGDNDRKHQLNVSLPKKSKFYLRHRNSYFGSYPEF